MEEPSLPLVTISILLLMWRLKAVGGRSVPIEVLRLKLKPEQRNSFGVPIQNLEEIMLVVSTKKNDQELLSMTPLGVAFVRQFEEMELDKLGKKDQNNGLPTAFKFDINLFGNG